MEKYEYEFCLKMYNFFNNLYRYIKKKTSTAHKPTANFVSGFFLDARNSFLNKITISINIIKNTRARELQKYIRADTALK